MKLYKLSQNTNKGYGVCRSIIVCARYPKTAKRISPGNSDVDVYNKFVHDWADIKDIECEYIGEAASHIKKGVVHVNYAVLG